uniref:2'-5' oligoadenylate synthase n=1 Tax=Latimeria chalumnae TaxID=7897 RepID=H3BFZ3_LATCH
NRMDLYQTPAKDLDKYIFNHLQPTEFQSQVREAIHRICEFLRTKCFQGSRLNIKVIKAVKGGSSGKGTALKSGSDADLVVFLDCFKSYKQQRDCRHEVIEEICQKLLKNKQSLAYNIDIEDPKRCVNFTIRSKKKLESIEVDVLPAYDALGPITTKPDAQVYADLINANAIPGEFSTCFTELQRNFVKYCRPKVKGLLRLVKYWYKTYAKPMRQEGRLPPKYALELLTIYVWETGSGKESFKTEEGFRTVLEMICNYEDICVYWTEYYDFQNAVVGNHLRKMLTAKRPIILDPADPTGNVASGGRWDLLAKEAAECLRTPCVNTATAWDVNTYVLKIFIANCANLSCLLS